jgi:4-hydroxy-tetrahydrodipicolinate synthase
MLAGVIPALPTLFRGDYSYDSAAMRRHVDRLLADGVHGLFILGGVGEFLHLKTGERRDVAADVLKYVAGRVPVIVGTGSSSTLEAVELTQHAAGAGATAAAVLTPSAWHLEEDQLVGHYASVANAVDLPLLIYNLPSMTGINIRTDIVVRLMVEFDNIRGLIDVTDSLRQIRQRVNRLKAVQADSILLGGHEEHLLDLLLLRGDGVVTGTGNLTPRPAVALFDAIQRQDHAMAMRQQELLLRMAGLEGVRGSPASVLKEAMHALGLIETATARPPAFPLTGESRKAMRQYVDDLRTLLAAEAGAHDGDQTANEPAT